MRNKKGCLIVIIPVLFNLILGGMSVNYILSWFGKDMSVLGDMLMGLFVAELSIPVAIGGWFLELFGIF